MLAREGGAGIGRHPTCVHAGYVSVAVCACARVHVCKLAVD